MIAPRTIAWATAVVWFAWTHATQELLGRHEVFGLATPDFGMVLFVEASEADAITHQLTESGETVVDLGEVEEGEGKGEKGAECVIPRGSAMSGTRMPHNKDEAAHTQEHARDGSVQALSVCLSGWQTHLGGS